LLNTTSVTFSTAPSVFECVGVPTSGYISPFQQQMMYNFSETGISGILLENNYFIFSFSEISVCYLKFQLAEGLIFLGLA